MLWLRIRVHLVFRKSICKIPNFLKFKYPFIDFRLFLVAGIWPNLWEFLFLRITDDSKFAKVPSYIYLFDGCFCNCCIMHPNPIYPIQGSTTGWAACRWPAATSPHASTRIATATATSSSPTSASRPRTSTWRSCSCGQFWLFGNSKHSKCKLISF